MLCADTAPLFCNADCTILETIDVLFNNPPAKTIKEAQMSNESKTASRKARPLPWQKAARVPTDPWPAEPPGVREVTVNRSREPREVLNAVGIILNADFEIISTMPSQGMGTEESVPVDFFRLGYWATDQQVFEAYYKKDLIPDQYAQAKVNEDPVFAKQYPNATLWRHGDATHSLAFCQLYNAECFMYCMRRTDELWSPLWWFGGRPR